MRTRHELWATKMIMTELVVCPQCGGAGLLEGAGWRSMGEPDLRLFSGSVAAGGAREASADPARI